MKGNSFFFQCHPNIVSYHDNSAILIATTKKIYMNVEERRHVSVGVFIIKGHLKYYADVKENNVEFFSLDEIEGLQFLQIFRKIFRLVPENGHSRSV